MTMENPQVKHTNRNLFPALDIRDSRGLELADEFNISSIQTMASIAPTLELNLGYNIYIPDMNEPIKLNDNF